MNKFLQQVHQWNSLHRLFQLFGGYSPCFYFDDGVLSYHHDQSNLKPKLLNPVICSDPSFVVPGDPEVVIFVLM